jgi:hypothetical protein
VPKEYARGRLLIVLGFGVFLLAQGVLSAASSPEPYPTFRLPGFGAAPDRSGLFPITTVAITISYVDGSVEMPSVTTFMGEIGFSSSRSILDRVFRGVQQADLDVSVIEWTRDRASSLGNGTKPLTVTLCWQSGYVDVHTYELKRMSPCSTTSIAL